MVQHRSDGVDVGKRSDLRQSPLGLLRRHVGRSAQRVSVERAQARVLRPLVTVAVGADRRLPAAPDGRLSIVRPIEHPRQAPIHDVDGTEAPDHDVGRFQIPVNDLLRVRIGHRFAHLDHHAERSGQPPLGIVRVHALHHRFEGLPPHELHREIGPPLRIDADLVDRRNAGVVELGRDLGFLQKTVEFSQLVIADALIRTGASRTNDLHRQVTVQILVPYARHDPHAAGAELLAPLVAIVAVVAAGEVAQRAQDRFVFRLLCSASTGLREAVQAKLLHARAGLHPFAV